MEGPYTAYCDKYCAGFDVWEPIVTNRRLPKVLATFSASSPPPPSAVPLLQSGEPPIWTLDALFLLPKGRLKYYKKLYSRLLKSTTPGRSDHRLLIGALDKLDRLMSTLEVRGDIQVSLLRPASPPTVPAAPLASPRPQAAEDEIVIDLRTQSVSGNSVPLSTAPSPPRSQPEPAAGSESSSARASSSTNG